MVLIPHLGPGLIVVNVCLNLGLVKFWSRSHAKVSVDHWFLCINAKQVIEPS